MAVKCNLKEIRAERNIQQDVLATALQTDVRTISRYCICQPKIRSTAH